MRLVTRIKHLKERLINKAKKRGLYENFGDNEVRQLREEYNELYLRYGTPEERGQAQLIADFDKWCGLVCDGDLQWLIFVLSVISLVVVLCVIVSFVWKSMV